MVKENEHDYLNHPPSSEKGIKFLEVIPIGWQQRKEQYLLKILIDMNRRIEELERNHVPRESN